MLPPLSSASPPIPIPPIPPIRPQPRFLGDGLDDDEPSGDGLPSGIDDLFENLGSDLDGQLNLPEPLDHAAIEANLAPKKVVPLDPFAISTSATEPGKKSVQRRPNVKLDEDRLLDPKIGIPKLISLALAFNPSGKGNEREDLKRMLKMYRLWTHTMFPKGTFIDTIETVEKLGHKRNMRNALKGWREEQAGSKKKKKPNQSPSDAPSEQPDAHPRPPQAPIPTFEPSEPAAVVPTDGPLFRPPDDEDEFPDDDEELAGIFEKIDQPTKPSNPALQKPLFLPEDDHEQYAEEEELLRQAEEHEKDLQSGTRLPLQPTDLENRPLSGPSEGDIQNEEAHDWDDLYK